MSGRKGTSAGGTLLELWRPPKGAGEPDGCLATTYTFAPGLFDEQCLARFLDIESEPNREDLAFLLERETRLGSVYAGVLVDHTQAGVEHSLRWDVLPVRVKSGKQHAKLSLLVWTHAIRVIVTSANLTEPGYRTNFEVAAVVDGSPEGIDSALVTECIGFLRALLALVPGGAAEVTRAEGFLARVAKRIEGWAPARQSGPVRQSLACTLPALGSGRPARSSLEEVIGACRRRGSSPHEVWVASPFFDLEDAPSRTAAALCKLMARGTQREITFCVPGSEGGEQRGSPQIGAPKALVVTPRTYQADVRVELLPELDEEKNRRPWHAKMLALLSYDEYSALMVGSSNFTRAGLGIDGARNCEANLVTVVAGAGSQGEAVKLESVWPEMTHVKDPESAEWLGTSNGAEEEEQASCVPMPAGFLSATYHAGDERSISLRLDPAHLPEEWQVHACGRDQRRLLAAPGWRRDGCPTLVGIAWEPVQPPDRLLVRWGGHEAFLPLNVQDGSKLPAPAQLESMSAEDMLGILAAADPGAAFRVWARQQQPPGSTDDDLDAAIPVDLDPLRRYDLQATFLHRIRRRARVLARFRENLERPVWGRQALEWRLRGLVGVAPFVDRLLREFERADGARGEALLTLADVLLVLRDVEYRAGDGALQGAEFEEVYRPFLSELVTRIDRAVAVAKGHLADEVLGFWARVIARCRT